MNRNCLFCYQPLAPGQIDFHPGCSRKIFGKPAPPELPYSEDDMLKLAEKVIQSRVAVAGVQPKLSLHLEKAHRGQSPARFTIVGLWGQYILKPPANQYPFLPELEDLTMHLAQSCRMATVPHSLVRLKSGTLAYLTKRIDRERGIEIHIEDMCQLSGRLTEHKYHGSHEQIAKIILRHSVHPGLDLINFFEQVLFSFINGNADMHLKNFSLIDQPEIGWILAPAYDLVPTALVVKGDPEELALTLNGKKRNFTRKDFENVFTAFGLEQKTISGLFKKFEHGQAEWQKWIEAAFIPTGLKSAYNALIQSRMKQIGIT
ncbi:MAG: HipA domain-containing protein [Candidatus Marinimicrobia bacterium]|nr:HipA domain-containing protein [Candidatus Neomarinimicrobiota bacterium]